MSLVAAARSGVLLLAILTSLPARAVDNLFVEWSDQAKDPKALMGNPVYQRTLSCVAAGSALSCELLVAMVGRNCPMLVRPSSYSTLRGDLRIARFGDTVNIEADDGIYTTKLAVVLAKRSPTTVLAKQVSGFQISKPTGNDKIVATELVGFLSRDGRFYGEVDLGCSRMTIIATEGVAK